MYETTVKILKILYQTKITKENLAHNLNLKENTVAKSILEINDFLERLGFSKIYIQDRNLKLDLTKMQWSQVFQKLDSLTFDEKVEYLYVKLIYFESINLEKEKNTLGISRSSIDRCFFSVKTLLEKNGSVVEYNKDRMNCLVSISSYDKKMFTLKVAKLILEEDILTLSQKKLLNSMKNFVIKIRIAKLMSIYKCLKIPVTTTLLSFLCALDIYINRFYLNNQFENFDIKEIEKNNIPKKTNILVNYIGYSFSENYKKCLVYYINEIYLNRYYFLEDTLDKANEIIEKILIKFKINDEKFEVQLLECLYLGILKKENNIYKLRNVYFDYDEIILLDMLNLLLEECGVELYLCDKYRIIFLLKIKILQMSIKKEKKVLVLIQETNLIRQNTLKKELEEKFININFDIECNFFKFKHKYKLEYDYIIDDLEINLGKGDIFNRIKNKLQTLIIEKISLD